MEMFSKAFIDMFTSGQYFDRNTARFDYPAMALILPIIYKAAQCFNSLLLMNRIKTFLCRCSGVDKKLLENCPTDASKYAGIGATLLFTGLFAGLGAGYALMMVFENAFIAALGALIWGLMIFNLDRYIVLSLRKCKNIRIELLTALPRVALAILISKPLELKIFEKEVETELLVMQQQAVIKLESKVRGKYAVLQRELKSEIELLKGELQIASQKRDELVKIARMEADGTGGTKKRNAGPIYRIKKADADKAQLEFETLSKKNNALVADKNKTLSSLDRKIEADLRTLEPVQLGGLASRLDALKRLTASSDAIWMANLFIILLFIIIETIPILVKLISSKSPYDYLLETLEYRYKMKSVNDRAYIHHQLKKKANKYPSPEKKFIFEKLDVELDKF